MVFVGHIDTTAPSIWATAAQEMALVKKSGSGAKTRSKTPIDAHMRDLRAQTLI